MKNIKITILLIFLSAFCSISNSAQQTSPSPPSEELQRRITQMEAEMKEMREELVKIKQSFPVNQPTPQTVSNDTTVAKSETNAETKSESKPNLNGRSD